MRSKEDWVSFLQRQHPIGFPLEVSVVMLKKKVISTIKYLDGTQKWVNGDFLAKYMGLKEDNWNGGIVVGERLPGKDKRYYISVVLKSLGVFIHNNKYAYTGEYNDSASTE